MQNLQDFRILKSAGVISRNLISPRTVKRMLCNAHQFYMSVSHLFYIFYDRLGELSVCVESFIFPSRVTHPRTHMNFIDRHRILLMIPCLPRFHLQASSVRSYTGKIRNTRRRSRTKLRRIRKRIRLIKKEARLSASPIQNL